MIAYFFYRSLSPKIKNGSGKFNKILKIESSAQKKNSKTKILSKTTISKFELKSIHRKSSNILPESTLNDLDFKKRYHKSCKYSPKINFEIQKKDNISKCTDENFKKTISFDVFRNKQEHISSKTAVRENSISNKLLSPTLRNEPYSELIESLSATHSKHLSNISTSQSESLFLPNKKYIKFNTNCRENKENLLPNYDNFRLICEQFQNKITQGFVENNDTLNVEKHLIASRDDKNYLNNSHTENKNIEIISHNSIVFNNNNININVPIASEKLTDTHENCIHCVDVTNYTSDNVKSLSDSNSDSTISNESVKTSIQMITNTTASLNNNISMEEKSLNSYNTTQSFGYEVQESISSIEPSIVGSEHLITHTNFDLQDISSDSSSSFQGLFDENSALDNVRSKVCY